MASKKNLPKSKSSSHVEKKDSVVLAHLIQPAMLLNDNFFKRYWAGMLILAVVAAGLYWKSVSYEYVLDDKIVISENNYVKKGLSGIWEIFSTESFQGYFGEQKDLLVGARYRPLSIVTFAIEHHFFGLNPRIGHIGNILLYILNILLLMRIISALFPAANKWYWSVPFFSAALFLTHPIHTEVVANIKGRDEIMTFLGALGAMFFYLKYLKSEKMGWLIAMCVSYFLGLLSKENALTFLAIIPATGYFFTSASKKIQWRAILALLAVSVIYIYIRGSVIGYFLVGNVEVKALMNNPFLEMNAAQKYATILYTLGLYIKLMFFPHPLTHDYYPYHIPIMEWYKPGVLISLIMYGALVYWFFKGLKIRAKYSYGILFYLATLSIVSNLVFPVGTFMNERFIYISSAAFCVFLAYFAVEHLKSMRRIPSSLALYGGIGLLLVYLLFFTWKTWDRIPVWKNGFELNKSAVQVSTNSARANMFMGTAYFNLYKEEQDSLKRKELLALAEPYIERSLEIHPGYGDGLLMKAGVAAEKYRFDKNIDTLLESFYLILTRRPSQQYTLEYLDYLIRIRAEPAKQEEFYFKLAYQHFLKQENRPDVALNFLSKGLQIAPESARLNKAAAIIYEKQGNTMEARNFNNRANSLLPGIEL